MADEGWREGAEQIPGILNETPDAVTEEEFWSAQDAAEYWTVPMAMPCTQDGTEESCSQLASETKGLSHLCLGFHSQILCSELTMHDFL